MPSVNLSFKIHIPQSLKPLNEGRDDSSKISFNSSEHKIIVGKYSDECFLPLNRYLLSLILAHKGKFRIAFSFSGTTLELLQEFRPDVIKSFRKLAATGCVDFFSETYYNSLSWYYSKNEFARQTKKHHDLIRELFGIEPKVFRNDDLEFSNDLANFIAEMGYIGLLSNGEEISFSGPGPDQIYSSTEIPDFGIMFRNRTLENEIITSLRENNQKNYVAFPETYFKQQLKYNSITSMLFDYELFGIKNQASKGNFDFLELFFSFLLTKTQWKFETPAEAIANAYPKIKIDLPAPGFTNNSINETKPVNRILNHNKTLDKVYSIEYLVNKSNLPDAYDQWGKLQSIGQFFFKADKWMTSNTKNIHPSLISNEKAYRDYKNALLDFEVRLINKELSDIKDKYKYASALNLY